MILTERKAPFVTWAESRDNTGQVYRIDEIYRDPDGRITHYYALNKENRPAVSSSYTYDREGRLRSHLLNTHFLTEYEYYQIGDREVAVAQHYFDYGGWIPAFIDEKGFAVLAIPREPNRKPLFYVAEKEGKLLGLDPIAPSSWQINYVGRYGSLVPDDDPNERFIDARGESLPVCLPIAGRVDGPCFFEPAPIYPQNLPFHPSPRTR